MTTERDLIFSPSPTRLRGDLPSRREVTASAQMTADVREQQGLFRDVEQLAREHGAGAVVDSWEPDVEWLGGEVTLHAS